MNLLKPSISGSHAEAKDAARWRVATAKVGEIKVPSTLIGLLQARLDGLPASESDLLQRAAVVGRLFWMASWPNWPRATSWISQVDRS